MPNKSRVYLSSLQRQSTGEEQVVREMRRTGKDLGRREESQCAAETIDRRESKGQAGSVHQIHRH